MEEKKSLLKTFFQKCIFIEYSEEEKKSLPKEIFLIAGIVFIFSSILIFFDIQKIEYSSIFNVVYIIILGCCIGFYKEKKNSSSKNKKSLLNLILRIAFYLLLFFIFYLIFSYFSVTQ